MAEREKSQKGRKINVFRQRRILVTGSTGFIGSNLVSALLREGHTLRTLVRDKRRKMALNGVELFEGDLTKPESLIGIEEDIDIVIHCAGILEKWGTDEAILYDVNVQGSINLLKRFTGRRLHRFIHLSAGGVTGPIDGTAVDETYACKPVTAYEKSKYLAEQKMLDLSKQMDIPVLVLRPTFTYGPGDLHKMALFKAVKEGRYVFIGNGRSVNHPVYIDDLVSGILLAIEKGRVGDVYIIGGERPVTKRELVYTIADALEVKRPKMKIPRCFAWSAGLGFEFLGRTFRFTPSLTRTRVMMMADNFGYSIEKAKTELGYQWKTDLKDGIAKTVGYYVEHGLL